MAATTITGEMSSLSTVEARLPPGFRFHPNDEELVCDYLLKWLTGDQILRPNQYCPSLIQVHLNNCEPWDIPETACVGGKEWYFYSQQDRKYATGVRTNRATASGYWKATGKDRPIFQKECLVGMRKTLVFHKGRAPRGTKTDWVMHEFRLQGTTLAHNTISTNPDMENWVLCRVSYKKKTSGKQETGRICEDKTSDSSPSAIMYDQNNQWCIEQVPCFSIYTPAQTSPTFCLNTNIINPTGPEDLPTNPIIPTYGAWVNIGTYY